MAFFYNGVNIDEAKGSSNPMEQPFSWLQDIMAESLPNARSKVVSNFVTMQHHVYELLHGRSKPFMRLGPMNQCTLAWFLIGWKMAWAI
jgi:hypothetical protein